MNAPVVGIIIFIFIIFAAVQIGYITYQESTRVKISIDSNAARSQEENSGMYIMYINCSYDQYLNQTIVRARNDGRQKLSLEQLDVFFSDRFPRNESNRTFELWEETNVIDPLHWNPKEVLNVTLFKNLTNNTKYTFVISNEFGIEAETDCVATNPGLAPSCLKFSNCAPCLNPLDSLNCVWRVQGQDSECGYPFDLCNPDSGSCYNETEGCP